MVAGLRVVAVARRRDKLERLQKHVVEVGNVAPVDFLPVVCDITKEAEVGGYGGYGQWLCAALSCYFCNRVTMHSFTVRGQAAGERRARTQQAVTTTQQSAAHGTCL